MLAVHAHCAEQKKFSWCHFAHHIRHYNQFAIKNKQNTHFETFTVLHFSWLIFTPPRREKHFNPNKNIRHRNNISDVRSVLFEWKCSKIFLWCSWEPRRIRLKWLTASFLLNRNYKPADKQNKEPSLAALIINEKRRMQVICDWWKTDVSTEKVLPKIDFSMKSVNISMTLV